MADQADDHGKEPLASFDHGRSRGKNPVDESDHQHGIVSEDTVYRYLCPARKAGSIIGIGGEIVKQIRAETKANVRISETVPGCEERIVTVYSSSEETNLFEDSGEYVSPAQDALFKIHDRIIADELPIDEELEQTLITVRMLVPSDQIGCVIGRGGSVIQSIRSETGAQIRVLKDEYLPPCALNFDELLQVIGEPEVVRKALYQLSSCLHENPSRSQHLLLSASYKISQSGGILLGPNAGIPLSSHHVNRDEAYMKEFSLRILCPTGKVGAVIGKGGSVIKQIRQESGAFIRVDSSSGTEEDVCIIYITAKEYLEDPSATITAVVRMQPRCSEKTERESGDPVITTRLLVPSSQVGCLIGKGGAIISEMRNVTRANIRILSKENLPEVASEDDEMVQITGGTIAAANALVQVSLRLRANLFEKEGPLAMFPPPSPYTYLSGDMRDRSRSGGRDSQLRGQRRGQGHSSYSGGYGSVEAFSGDSYASPMQSSSNTGYGADGGSSAHYS